VRNTLTFVCVRKEGKGRGGTQDRGKVREEEEEGKENLERRID
jgi:hypothetical protein